jgi:hypothetical protein
MAGSGCEIVPSSDRVLNDCHVVRSVIVTGKVDDYTGCYIGWLHEANVTSSLWTVEALSVNDGLTKKQSCVGRDNDQVIERSHE